MSDGVTLPLWLFVLICVLAALAALDRLLLPSARWYLRRRANRVIEELNERLSLRLQPFKLTKRQALIDRVLYDPAVVEAVAAVAGERGMRHDEALAKAERYAREIVPSFNAYAYFRVGYRIARGLARILYRVRLGYADEAGLSEVPRNASVVFVMNHRSNMDYVLVAYLVARHSALSYAVGEWARVWPLQALIRAMGAYFVRRDSGDPLYRRVLASYVRLATAGGVTQAIYPEGGLSRDGRLRPLKLGLLGYMLKSFDPEAERDLVFVPVGINYDRVLEDRTLVRGADRERARRGKVFMVATLSGFVLRNLWLAARGRWYRFGYAGVGFGTPISTRDYLRRNSLDLAHLDESAIHTAIERLGATLMAAAGQVIPALPVALAATVFTNHPDEAISEIELKAGIHAVAHGLEARGAHVYVPRANQDYAVTVGLRMLTLRHLVTETAEGLYRARAEELPLLRYYANSIAHLLGAESGG